MSKNNGQSPLLTAEDILKAQDIQFELVEVPEWGGTVRVRGLTGKERDHFESLVRPLDGKPRAGNIRARMASVTIVDQDGKQLFTSAQIEALGKKSATALDSVFTVAMRLSALRQGDIEEMTENLD